MKTRTRRRSRPLAIGGLYYSQDGEHSYQGVIIDSSEYMIDGVGRKGKPHVWHDCRHSSFGASVLAGVSGYYHNDDPDNPNWLFLEPFVVYEAALQQYSSERFVATSRKLFQGLRAQNKVEWVSKLRFTSADSDFNLIVFLAELATLKRAFRSIWPAVLKLRKRWIRSSQRGEPLPRIMLDLFTAGWLEWSFGVGAFVRDVIKLAGIVSRWDTDFNEFVGRMGVPRRAQWGTPGSLALPVDEFVSFTIHGVNVRAVWRYEFPNGSPYPQPNGSMTASFRYYSRVLTQNFGHLKFFMQRLGVKWDPSTVWELIPFSFIIDWIYPVGSWLKDKSVDLVDVNVVIDGIGFKNLLHVRRTLYAKVDGGDYSRYIATEGCREYGRVSVSTDVLPKELEFQKATLRKAITGGSLVWQLFLKR